MPSPSIPAPVAAVTGAGSGIGQAAAVALARAGYRLVIMGRTREALTHTAAVCQGLGPAPAQPGAHAGPAVEVVGGDVADPFQCRHFIDRCAERFGRLDALVNCAGVAHSAPIDGHTDEMIRSTLATNTQGPACLIARAFALWRRQLGAATSSGAAADATPGAAARPGPAVVNVSSVASLDPFDGFFIYAASKAALDMLTLMAHRQGAAIGTGVRAFSINPAAVETAMLRGAFDESAVPRSATLSPAAVARVIVGCILGRHDAHAGRPLAVLPESARQWWERHTAARRAEAGSPHTTAAAIFPEDP